MAPNPHWVGGHLTPRGHHSHADALETPNPYQDTHNDQGPLRNAVNVSEGPLNPKGHPRSRGVNVAAAREAVLAGGSSPLTRGQRAGDGPAPSPSRIIPAHAGSTLRDAVSVSERPDHPRSRGVNTQQTPKSRRHKHPSSGH